MNKNKISPALINKVSTQSTQKQAVFVDCLNYYKTCKFLWQHNVNFKQYPFINCLKIDVDTPEIVSLSNEKNINYLYENQRVNIEFTGKTNINLQKLTQNKFLGRGQTICFIDTGIFPHADFLFPKNRIKKFIDLTNQKSFPYDDNGHGTFVAGIACSCGILNKQNMGYAPEADIVSIKALNTDGTSDSNKILDAMQWVYENYKKYNISVVCMSFGADTLNSSDPLSKGAEALWKKGLVVVAAAGNSGPAKNTIKSPGNNPNIITVGALDVSTLSVASFSSRGPTIYGHKPDLLAPAVNITSCNNLGEFYTEMSGTSVATPIVAGICADIKCRWPEMKNYQIKEFLMQNCKKITGDTDIEGAGYISF